MKTPRFPWVRLAESKMPAGPPAGKGVSMDGISGYKTFAKPSGEEARNPSHDDESMYRVDDADDLGKSQSRPDEIDHSRAQPSYNGLGEQDNSKTKYPYRDGVPNTHNASAKFVAELFLLETADQAQVAWEVSDRVAVKIADLLNGLDPKTMQRASGCAVDLKRADPRNLRWVFTVDAGNGPKAVKLKAQRSGNAVKLSKMDVWVACSCKAWRWQGPEYHAVSSEYLDGKQQGTASSPDVRDPDRRKFICKHVAAALLLAKQWEIPRK